MNLLRLLNLHVKFMRVPNSDSVGTNCTQSNPLALINTRFPIKMKSFNLIIWDIPIIFSPKI